MTPTRSLRKSLLAEADRRRVQALRAKASLLEPLKRLVEAESYRRQADVIERRLADENGGVSET